ncbi:MULTISPECIES: glycosyltransferase family 4 protein [unclassified Acinetobacter]|uniref:glycosyltransferase family 4 protein n=1 Tax=unclassified Acinetobacter TaxID=196816 RepID=UPI0035B82BAA
MQNSKKCIWLINQYASTPETGMGGRQYYLAKALSQQGYLVYVIAGSYSHILRHTKKFDGDFLIEDIDDNFKFVWVNLSPYEGAHNKKRIINEFVFAYKIRKLKSYLHKPDVVLQSSPALPTYFGALSLAKTFKAKFIFEVRDIWPKTLIELGGYSPSHPFVRLLQWIEDSAYRHADYAFSNLANAVKHMASRGLDAKKFHWIPNGVFLDEVNNKQALTAEILQQLPKDKFIVGYTGSIGLANAMKYLIDAIPHIPSREQMHFILVGEGKEKQSLLEQAQRLGVTNLTFIEPIAKAQIQTMLEQFDVCYIGWQNKPIYELGIAANKLPEYMYSARPVVHSFSGEGDFVKIANAGVSVTAEDATAIAQAIQQIYDMTPAQRQQLGENGKQFVLENFDYDKIASKMANILFGEK